MPKFNIEMEFYGKKLKTTVEADNEFRAEMKVRERLHVTKIEWVEEEKPDDLDFLKDIFNIKK